MRKLTILVAGGTGFVGSKVVELLRKDGHETIIYHRGQRAVPTHADIIINCVGIIREDGETFKEAHVDLVRWLVRLGRKLRVRQFVHVSALGVEHERTAYQRSKLHAERIIQSSGLPYAIIRPSMIFGDRDRSVNLFRKMCRTGFFPVLAKGTVQPIVRLMALFARVIRTLPTKEQLIMLGQQNTTGDRTVVRLGIDNPRLR